MALSPVLCIPPFGVGRAKLPRASDFYYSVWAGVLVVRCLRFPPSSFSSSCVSPQVSDQEGKLATQGWNVWNKERWQSGKQSLVRWWCCSVLEHVLSREHDLLLWLHALNSPSVPWKIQPVIHRERGRKRDRWRESEKERVKGSYYLNS